MASNPLKKDPTRTTMLRRRFVTAMRKRFNALKKKVRELVITDDAFGLITSQPFAFNVEKQAWRFRTDPEKVESFNKWFKGQVDENILAVSGPTAEPWTSTYVESAYKKGALRAYTDTHKSELAKSPDFYEGSKAQFLQDAFGRPEAVNKLRMVYLRTFEELKGITAVMSQQMSRVLAEGLANGLGAAEIARNLSNTITKINRTRAMVMARTEIIRAHAEGQLDAFELLGIEKVGAMVEWSTADDDKVCPLCRPLEGEIYTIKEARGKIPRHPNCRCAWIPAFEEKEKRKAA